MEALQLEEQPVVELAQARQRAVEQTVVAERIPGAQETAERPVVELARARQQAAEQRVPAVVPVQGHLRVAGQTRAGGLQVEEPQVRLAARVMRAQLQLTAPQVVETVVVQPAIKVLVRELAEARDQTVGLGLERQTIRCLRWHCSPVYLPQPIMDKRM